MACNTIILYDIENLLGVFSGKANTVLNLDEIYKRVLEMEGVTGVSIQRAYADWGIPMHRNLRNAVLQVGIEPIQIFNTNQNDRVKNAADVSLIIDAVDLAARRPEIENFVIASGDGIFAFLSKKLHEYGKRVIGCSYEKVANVIFRNSCDFFIKLEKTDDVIIATSTNRKANTETTATKTAKKQLAKLPKTKYTETLLAAEIKPTQDLGDVAGVMHMVRQLVEALFVEETKDLPGLEISVFVTYIKHYVPGFNVRQQGFSRISDYIKLVLTGSPYCTYTLEPNVVLMGLRTMAEAADGKIIDDVNGLLVVTPEGERYNSIFNVPPGTPFVHTVSPTPPIKKTQKKEKRVPAKRGRKPKAAPEVIEPVVETSEEGNLRKRIKSKFEALAAKNTLSEAEIKKLTTLEYAKTTFGVRAPVFREVDPKIDLREQRTIKGKVKYWKEIFEFGGKSFIVYKEWTNLHKERFMIWVGDK